MAVAWTHQGNSSHSVHPAAPPSCTGANPSQLLQLLKPSQISVLALDWKALLAAAMPATAMAVLSPEDDAGAAHVDDATGNTPLHLVAETGATFETVVGLLRLGLPIDAANKEGDTALHVAARAGHVQVRDHCSRGGWRLRALSLACGWGAGIAGVRVVWDRVRRVACVGLPWPLGPEYCSTGELPVCSLYVECTWGWSCNGVRTRRHTTMTVPLRAELYLCLSSRRLPCRAVRMVSLRAHHAGVQGAVRVWGRRS